MFDLIISGGRIVDGTGAPWFYGDIGIKRDKIEAIGRLSGAPCRQRLDAAGKVVAPGFIDTHVHGDLVLFADPLHEPAIRQGVTTYLLGQDGVAMAPSSRSTLDYMMRYTAGFSGGVQFREAQCLREHSFLSVADYLAALDRRSAINVAYLIPNGNLRMEVMGLATRPPTEDEIRQMRRLVREGMEQGAVGLSTGMDYIPSRYATTEELIELCSEMSPYQGVYVTHMRRYDAEGLDESMGEVFRIGREADVPVHISHFNSPAELALPKIDQARSAGIDVTYDLYCYLKGSSILAMVALPAWVQEGGIEATMQRLRDAEIRQRIELANKPARGPTEEVTLTYVAAEEFRCFEGSTLAEAAEKRGQSIVDFVCDVLLASDMAVGCIASHRRRSEEDTRQMLRHPAQMAGSDGIFTGSRPHPRGWGCFARYLGHYVRDEPAWTLEQAVQHLAGHAAIRYGLRDRGLLRPGYAADIVVFDDSTIADRATYENPRKLAVGVEHVLVNGEPVLLAGERTKATPGRALKKIR
ncbi:MAG: N-acyl-D-amino-acid deacylase [Gemmatales bacterium]|nr:MAG: N-acyl-D-amino-acid deacylase [Gemmatales bacterium]